MSYVGTIHPPTLDVPRRQELLRQLETANRWAWPVLTLQLLAIVGLCMIIDWGQVSRQPLVSTIALGVVVGPFATAHLQHWMRKKKEIGELKEQTRFGQFDKHRLRSLFLDTLKRLGLPNEHLPVYIVADKQLNAMVVHVGLGPLFRWFNGIYLHRQTLHKLGAEEVQDIMGHELGHYYRYYLVLDRFRLVSLTLGGLMGLAVVDLFGMDGVFSVIALLACGSIFWMVSGWPYARHAQAIEYLCDDFGAQVHGVATSISGLMKLGADAELMTAIQQQAFFSKRKGSLLAHEVVEAVLAAVPYGHTSREELSEAVELSLKQRAQQGASLGGFLRYVWQSDIDAEADEEFEKELKKLQSLQRLPRIEWESLLPDPQCIEFSGARLERLIELIEGNPDAELFRTPDVLSGAGSHPPTKLRILYLWRNRQGIESPMASLTSRYARV
jgi:Zn-dependent protease with chaperone function